MRISRPLSMRGAVAVAAILACVAAGSTYAAVRGGGKSAAQGTALSAAVDQLGSLEGGSAKSASRFGLGGYEVTFGVNVSTCVAVASPGTFNLGTYYLDAIGSTQVPGSGGNKTVDVSFNRNGNLHVDTDFMLVVAC